ncbi:MAG: hypothetical protein HOP10_08140 [Chitinophagaceae bacterium]|nr:hypothetical protein [Chitinophagaceae bacterium]
MTTNGKNLQKIFLACFGLFAGTAFCMKWMEGDFVYKGGKFTIIGLEISYTREKVTAILSGMDDHVKTILRYHLCFDFLFMLAVYPGIAVLCLMARNKSTGIVLQKILMTLAALQLMAWACDILENYCLLKWIKGSAIGNEFNLYHFIVVVKWIIALAGALLAIPLIVRKYRVTQKN